MIPDMALSTAFTRLFGVRHPIALAPMGGSAGGALAAAVSRGGGLGLLGAGAATGRGWTVSCRSSRAPAPPWGIGFLTWAIDAGAVEQALEYGPRAVMLSFGDPSPFAKVIRGPARPDHPGHRSRGGQARRWTWAPTSSWRRAPRPVARRPAGRSTLPFVPVVVDLAGRVRSWPPVGSPTAGVSPRPWPGRGRCPDRHPLPGHGRGPGGSRDRSRRSSKDAGRTPSAAASWTSSAARVGRRSTRPGPSAIRTSTGGAAGRPSWREMLRPDRTTIRRRPGRDPSPSRSGRARRRPHHRRALRRGPGRILATQAEDALASAANRIS